MKYVITLLVVLTSTAGVFAGGYDDSVNWPLCGRISESPPVNWQVTAGCPVDRQGSAAYSDYPLSSTFGPRQKASAGYHYDYHRGIDIPTAINTPVFAVSAGRVVIAGEHSAYSDPLVQIEHRRPGASSCRAGGGCYYSNYMHLASWVVASGAQVNKGDLIAYTGVSASGFSHLHFEVRDANPADLYSRWQRDAVHPLRVLPYSRNQSNPMTVAFSEVQSLGGNAMQVSLRIEQAAAAERLDLAKVSVRAYRWLASAGEYQEVTQPGNSPDDSGFYAHPTFLDFEQNNFDFSHKDSASYPWASFANCPYAEDHPAAYTANIHLDAQDPADTSVGHFNGQYIAPDQFNAYSSVYGLTLSFASVLGDDQGPSLTCLVAEASDVSGQQVFAEWGDCGRETGFEAAALAEAPSAAVRNKGKKVR
ncbi:MULTISPECIES: M23 family metallopeptidase [Zhongshania]|jgi:hypothetical protein|uniref:M23ase beta-sheet core domain-containing protein n=1 Tax=Zhongshania antarctica TaxID=641702 RepID=A0A840R753_9GAMM|nr:MULTISPECIES: M23 family metallopeptidase [Zhongshania]MBB5189129.1 hypothetical protein [Zhongshania antarctica]